MGLILRTGDVPAARRWPGGRAEPSFGLARDADGDPNSVYGWEDFSVSVRSSAGVRISQQTAMSITTVYACVKYKCEDLAKLGVSIFKGERKGAHFPAKEHFLYQLLQKPAPWLTQFEFISMMQMGLELRGNAYAVIVRDWRGTPQMLVPINPDKVALWEAPTGELFYMVTRTGLHELYMLRNEPLLVPAEDVLHLKGLTSNGLLGFSPIALEREALGLALAQEQMASRWAANGAHMQGVLTSDKSLSNEQKLHASQSWKAAQVGILNSGKIAVLEAGLKWEPLKLSMQDLEFIASRQFQVEEIARVFRVPLYMLAEVKGGSKTSVAQQAQEYLNYTLSSPIKMWEQRLAFTFDIDPDEMFLDFDEDRLLETDIGTRYGANRIALGGQPWMSVDEVRGNEGLAPQGGAAAELFRPVNMAPLMSDVFQGIADPDDPTLGDGADANSGSGPGSDQTGTGGDGGGRPPDDGSDPVASKVTDRSYAAKVKRIRALVHELLAA